MANFICSLRKTLKLCSGEALFYKDNSVPWCSRNNPAVSILSQPLLQTTLITTQSTLKAFVPCKGHSGPQCQSFWIEEIFHPRHTGLHRGESYTSRWFWWHWNYWVMVFVSSSRCFEHFFFLEKKKKLDILQKSASANSCLPPKALTAQSVCAKGNRLWKAVLELCVIASYCCEE